MAIANGLLIADVMHARARPRPNRFHYGVYYLCFALDELSKMGNALLSVNKLNLFSFFERDYGRKDNTGVEPWIRGLLAEWNIPEADGRIVLLTLPRQFGHVFNPVSFWFCLDKSGALRTVLSEVSNTFGERHCYMSFKEDRSVIDQDDWLRAEKIFHVSPFLDVTGYYLFRFAYRDDKIGVWINYHDEEGLMLSTAVVGKRHPLTALGLAWCFIRYPLVTFKVIGLIHYQAVRLWLKRMRYRPKPIPPITEVSR